MGPKKDLMGLGHVMWLGLGQVLGLGHRLQTELLGPLGLVLLL